MFVQDLVHRAAWEFGDAPAIVEGDRVLSFREFEERTNRLANALLDRGLTPGERVAVVLPNCTEELLTYVALARAGLHRVGLNARDSAEDQAFKVADSEARMFISDGVELATAVEHVLHREEVWELAQSGRPDEVDVPLEPHEPYRLAYTGGTTGKPKGVILTLRTLQAQVVNYLTEHVPGIRPGDVMLHAAPVSHASGSYFLPHLISGGVSHLLPRFHPGEFLEALERTRARRTFLVPTMMAAVVEDPNVDDVDASNLTRLCYGASPIAPSVARRAEEVFGQVLCQTYGQAEAPMTITLLRPEEHDRVGSAGRPYKMMRVRVLDDDDRPLPPGETGEIVTRGASVSAGYWNRPEATAETLRGGWLHTGDIGYQDDQGYVYLLDRRNDMIISGGFNVYPREVEDALTAHPAVVEAAVVSLPDEKWGEVVQAVLTVRSELDVQDLDEFMRTKVAGYKRPRGYHVWDELPQSGPGKIMRRTVRDRLRADSDAAGRVVGEVRA
jgi:acyl-CoA synthetase (AMP-forming)/AMP-acid ligase II